MSCQSPSPNPSPEGSPDKETGIGGGQTERQLTSRDKTLRFHLEEETESEFLIMKQS